MLYDANNNGVLDKKELVEALSATGYDDEEIEDMFEEFDADGNGEIDLEEFISISRRRISTKVSPAKLTNVRRRLGAPIVTRGEARTGRGLAANVSSRTSRRARL